MSAPRVGLIGARRRRQGLGPYVARFLSEAGAEVPCFLTTSESSRDEAAEQLAETAKLRPRGYIDLGAMLAAEQLDALAILSPHGEHAGHLEAALEAGLHALCEKPLVWGAGNLGVAAARVAAAFDDRGLLLWENCQWPYPLAAFERLHPGALDRTPRRFAMQLQPASRGARMLADSLPHPLSLLQALTPAGPCAVEGVRFSSTDPEAACVRVGFRHRAGDAVIEVEVELRHGSSQPREAGLTIDSHSARRLVAAEDYRLSFGDDGRTVPLEDPLALLVADFVRVLGDEAGGSGATRSGEIAQRMQLLGDIVDAYEHAGGRR